MSSFIILTYLGKENADMPTTIILVTNHPIPIHRHHVNDLPVLVSVALVQRVHDDAPHVTRSAIDLEIVHVPRIETERRTVLPNRRQRKVKDTNIAHP